MSDHKPQGWEPNPSKMGNWRAMFEQPRGATPTLPPTPSPAEAAGADDQLKHDPSEYWPWIVQRGRSRPAMMLELRRYEPRSELWQGWIMSYPSLQAVEYLGACMVALDFGTAQFVVRGNNLEELLRQLQERVVLAIQEYSAQVWPQLPTGPVVTAIEKVSDGN